MSQNRDIIFIPYNKILTIVARENRKKPTKAEEKMWVEVLKKKQFKGYKFLRQKPIDNFIVDFYCAKLQLVIEIDGDSHNEKQEYDQLRSEILQMHGLQVVRYKNEEVLYTIREVYENLSNKVDKIVSRL